MTQSLPKTKQVNTSLLEQASIHLLAAIGEKVKLPDNPSDFLSLMLQVLQARGYTLVEVEQRWNEVSK